QTYREAAELGRTLTDRLARWGDAHPDAQPITATAAPGGERDPRHHPAPFVRTKLQPPRPRTDLLVRERLIDRIRAQLTGTLLILVSAPAGTGKTTLLATAAATLGCPYAWMTLDADDNDLARFLAVLLASLDQLAPGIERAAAPLLATLRSG